MEKEKGEMNVPAIILSVIGLFALGLVISFVYLSLYGENYTNLYIEKLQNGEIKNPISEFQLMFVGNPSEQIPEGSEIITIPTEDGEKRIIIQANLGNLDVSSIQKELINYLSVILKFYNLHEIPFTSMTPKVQVFVDDIAYYAEIVKGDILIKEGEAEKPEITIRTTNEEIFKIIENNNYAEESFSSGKTILSITDNYFVLFAKGYFTLYKDFNSWNLQKK
jgi:hypothetical protein